MGGVFRNYLLREVLAAVASVTLVLLVILVTNEVARVLWRAAEGGYPRSVVLELIGAGTMQNLAVIMPIGLLLGVVLALGRMYHESEMVAAQACGVATGRVLRPVMAVALAIALLQCLITLVLAPGAAQRLFDLRKSAALAGQFSPIAPGKFATFGGAGTVVYAQSEDPDGTLRKVFVKRAHEKSLEVVTAQSARHEISNDGAVHTITLFDGERYEGVPGERRFRIIRFKENVIPVHVPDLDTSEVRIESVPTAELIRMGTSKAIAEFAWRTALPIMALVLAVIAVPLARLRPRQGRYAKVWLAILIYIAYTNLVATGRLAIERGSLPAWLGVWWVHAVILLAAWLILASPNWLARLRYKAAA
ncbi:MAG: LPS export ABC transporter permease LptF [Steroidobacteraceae bacterium]